MIQRLYIHNFRCFENFEIVLNSMSSVLIIGKNGSGKSTLARVLKIFQEIGRGTNRVGQLVKVKDFSIGRSEVPMRFEIEVLISEKTYKYAIAFELPENFRELRILEEKLEIDGQNVFSRTIAQVKLNGSPFTMDWHSVALPLIQGRSSIDPVNIFRIWLARMLILAPIPQHMTGQSTGATSEPNQDVSNFGDWFSGILGDFPAAYKTIDNYLSEIIPDLVEIKNESTGKNAKNMLVRFEKNNKFLEIDFEDLSDGEKCFFVCALVIASTKYYKPSFCFWDEPDSHISLPEIGHFILALRKSFTNSGQIILTSHNYESIRKFSEENSFYFYKNSHLEPTLIKHISENIENLYDALLLDEVIS